MDSPGSRSGKHVSKNTPFEIHEPGGDGSRDQNKMEASSELISERREQPKQRNGTPPSHPGAFARLALSHSETRGMDAVESQQEGGRHRL